METRPPAEGILKWLTATADKIGALARRTTTVPKSTRLWVFVYRLVRNVLVRSGIPGGLRREIEAKREPVEVDASPSPREDTLWEVLRDPRLSAFERVDPGLRRHHQARGTYKL